MVHVVVFIAWVGGGGIGRCGGGCGLEGVLLISPSIPTLPSFHAVELVKVCDGSDGGRSFFSHVDTILLRELVVLRIGRHRQTSARACSLWRVMAATTTSLFVAPWRPRRRCGGAKSGLKVLLHHLLKHYGVDDGSLAIVDAFFVFQLVADVLALVKLFEILLQQVVVLLRNKTSRRR